MSPSAQQLIKMRKILQITNLRNSHVTWARVLRFFAFFIFFCLFFYGGTGVSVAGEEEKGEASEVSRTGTRD